MCLKKGSHRMSIVQEFKDFAVKGNVVDIAVGLIIGAAFAKIVTALVSGVITPPIGVLLGGVDFSDLVLVIKAATDEAPAVLVSYGAFIQTVIDFTIIALAIFLVIKGINRLKRKEAEEAVAEEPPAPPAEQVLLAEIRDLLKARAQ
jgi:large conductance mechanosensitive channel